MMSGRRFKVTEATLRETQAIAGLGSYVIDVVTGRIETTDVLDVIFGIQQDSEHSVDRWLGMVHPADQSMVRDYFTHDVLDKRELFDLEYRIVRANDGAERWVHGRGELEFDADHVPVRLIGTVQDITERKDVEAALRESESRLRRIIEESPISMAIVSMEGVIEYINRRAVATFGYLPEDIPTMERWWVQAYPDAAYRAEVVAQWMGLVGAAMAQQREIERREYRTTCKDGTLKTMVIFGVPVSGKVFVMFEDITERKREEEDLRRSAELLESRVAERTQDLERANAALDRSVAQLRKLAMELTQTEERERKRLATVLHDHVQQYLVAATLRIGGLESDTPADIHDKDVREALSLLGEALTATRSLTSDLYPPVLSNLGLMPGLCWLADWMGDKHGLTVTVNGSGPGEVPESLCVVLFQAVRELLFNVVKHAGVDRATVTVEPQPALGSLRMVVADQGAGFPGQDPAVSGSTTGLGLFHLRERLACVGGTLAVESAPGQGAAITLTVPLA
jgi:PAS domain S-box-containing protein